MQAISCSTACEVKCAFLTLISCELSSCDRATHNFPQIDSYPRATHIIPGDVDTSLDVQCSSFSQAYV